MASYRGILIVWLAVVGLLNAQCLDPLGCAVGIGVEMNQVLSRAQLYHFISMDICNGNPVAISIHTANTSGAAGGVSRGVPTMTAITPLPSAPSEPILLPGQNFVISIDIGPIIKRQAAPSTQYVTVNGTLTESVLNAAQFILLDRSLYMQGLLVSTDPGVLFQDLVPQDTNGSISTTFSALDDTGGIEWENPAFTGGQAMFVRSDRGVIQVVFNNEIPPRATAVVLTGTPVSKIAVFSSLPLIFPSSSMGLPPSLLSASAVVTTTYDSPTVFTVMDTGFPVLKFSGASLTGTFVEPQSTALFAASSVFSIQEPAQTSETKVIGTQLSSESQIQQHLSSALIQIPIIPITSLPDQPQATNTGAAPYTSRAASANVASGSSLLEMQIPSSHATQAFVDSLSLGLPIQSSGQIGTAYLSNLVTIAPSSEMPAASVSHPT